MVEIGVISGGLAESGIDSYFLIYYRNAISPTLPACFNFYNFTGLREVTLLLLFNGLSNGIQSKDNCNSF